MDHAGQLSSGPGFSPIKMMDEPPSSLLFHIALWGDGLMFYCSFCAPQPSFLKWSSPPCTLYTLRHPLTLTHTHTRYSGIRQRRAERVLTENNMSVKVHSLLCVFKPKKHNPLKDKGGLPLSFFFSPPSHSPVLFFPRYMPLESFLIRLMRGISPGQPSVANGRGGEG